ncbi:MAG: NADH-quinone oxidoreductase subunit M, partial [Nitrospina sp.]|nr:NADH-quinone oxidoreductase subunit M [Nitrospina sp.]
MAILMDHLISWMIAVPFLGIVILAFVSDEKFIRRIAFGITIVEFFLSLVLWRNFDSTQQGMQFVERMEWMPTFNIQYAVGVDGISILLVILTTLLCPLCVLCSWTGITTRVRAFLS